MNKTLSLLAMLSLCFWSLPGASAGEKIDDSDNTPAVTRPETVASLPWIYVNGTDGARKTSKEFLSSLLTRSRLEELPEARVAAAWTGSLGEALGTDRKDMPTPKSLLKLGEKLGVDWVIASRADWHTRSIWIGLGPKTKSDCTVDILIVDVNRKEIALDAKRVKMESTAKEDALKAAGAILITGLFTVVSGGPKTPHEQRAVQLATAKAMQTWLMARPQNRKIESDRPVHAASEPHKK